LYIDVPGTIHIKLWTYIIIHSLPWAMNDVNAVYTVTELPR
jgi:hypothetical protein